jgi:dUTP pyrophosphatase
VTALTRADILELLGRDPPLAAGMPDPDHQVQPNGLDLTLDAIWRLEGPASLGVTVRDLPGRTPLVSDGNGWASLEQGSYLVRFTEVLRLPRDVIALGRPRSTLARSGVGMVLAVWDAGYEGRSEALLVVHTRAGFRVQRGARLAQLVFFRATGSTDAYSGAYQGEHLSDLVD